MHEFTWEQCKLSEIMIFNNGRKYNQKTNFSLKDNFISTKKVCPYRTNLSPQNLLRSENYHINHVYHKIILLISYSIKERPLMRTIPLSLLYHYNKTLITIVKTFYTDTFSQQ